MTLGQTSLEEIFETQIRTLALTLRPKTVNRYQSVARLFLGYLRAAFPQLRQLAALRRDPHLLGWFRALSEQQPPLKNSTRIDYLVCLHRLLDDLAVNGHPLQPDLIRREDFPPQPHYLPRPLSLEEDQLLQQELRRTDDLYANALLLIRATGIRLGECIHLPLDCLRQVGTEQWALHVPLGKLHTERLVPADFEVRRIVERITTLRTSSSLARCTNSQGFLLPRRGARHALVWPLLSALARAAKRAECITHVTSHRLRHTFATEMLRLGVSLPTLMKLLGHRDIRMTLRYLEVTQQDLQREFHQVRKNTARPHRVPILAPPKDMPSAGGLPGIRRALEATRHLLEMYRRQLSDEKTRRSLRRLDKRLLRVASQLKKIQTGKNEGRLAG
jgi:site-specific recombinase XerD